MRTFTKLMYCGKKKAKFETVFEERNPKEWYGASVTPIQTRFSLKEKFAKVLAPLTGAPAPASDSVHVDGAFYTGEYACPYCKSTRWISCGRDGTWFCWDGVAEDGRIVECPTCQSRINTGKLGTITSAEGTQGEKKGNGDSRYQMGDTKTPPKNNHTL